AAAVSVHTLNDFGGPIFPIHVYKHSRYGNIFQQSSAPSSEQTACYLYRSQSQAQLRDAVEPKRPVPANDGPDGHGCVRGLTRCASTLSPRCRSPSQPHPHLGSIPNAASVPSRKHLYAAFQSNRTQQ